jgi:hypothetical protein
MRQTEDAGKRGRKRQAQRRERERAEASVSRFFLEPPCKTPKTTFPPAIDHYGRTALTMPWARFTTARRALNLRRFEY